MMVHASVCHCHPELIGASKKNTVASVLAPNQRLEFIEIVSVVYEANSG